MRLLSLIPTIGCCLTGWGADVAPSITTQPAALTVPAGCPVTFAVSATGTEPLACQSFNTALGR